MSPGGRSAGGTVAGGMAQHGDEIDHHRRRLDPDRAKMLLAALGGGEDRDHSPHSHPGAHE
jgi:hypothetical protein